MLASLASNQEGWLSRYILQSDDKLLLQHIGKCFLDYSNLYLSYGYVYIDMYP